MCYAGVDKHNCLPLACNAYCMDNTKTQAPPLQLHFVKVIKAMYTNADTRFSYPKYRIRDCNNRYHWKEVRIYKELIKFFKSLSMYLGN